MVLTVSICSVLAFWLGRYAVLSLNKWVNTNIQKGYEIEDARRHEGIRRGVAEYLKAKRKWEDKGDSK